MCIRDSLQRAHRPERGRDRAERGLHIPRLRAAVEVHAPRGAGPDRARKAARDDRLRPVERRPQTVVAHPKRLVEEEEDLREAQRLEPFVVPDLERPVDVLAVDLADAVRRSVHEKDAPLVRIRTPEALLGLLEPHLVYVAERDTDAVRRQRAALPEVLDEMLALVVLAELEQRVALDLREDRLDVLEELAILAGKVVRELLALLPRKRLVRDELGRRGFRLRAGRGKNVRHGEGPALGEAAVVVALAPRDVLDRRDDEERVGAGSRIALERRQGSLRRRREKNGLTFEDGPVAIRARRRFRIEQDARVLSERGVLEIGPDLERPERVATAHGDAGVRRTRRDVDRRAVVVETAEEPERLGAASRLRRGRRRIHRDERRRGRQRGNRRRRRGGIVGTRSRGGQEGDDSQEPPARPHSLDLPPRLRFCAGEPLPGNLLARQIPGLNVLRDARTQELSAIQPRATLQSAVRRSRFLNTDARKVYADHHATTPLDPEVLEVMRPWLEGLAANPSSTHGPGRAAREAVEAARVEVARVLGAEPSEIVFTSGGTEANNLAVRGGARAAREADPSRSRVAFTAAEHAAVREAALSLNADGFEPVELRVNANGVPAAGAFPDFDERPP